MNITGVIYHHSDKNPTNKFLNKTYKDENYHLDKSLVCLENNIKLIHIFEHELNSVDVFNLIQKFKNHDISFNGNILEYVNTRSLEVTNNTDINAVLISKPCVIFTKF